MPLFRKRPVTVEAAQWFPDGPPIAGVFVEPAERSDMPGRPYVITIHGQRAYLDPGDWVITESDNKHHYPCKPAEFARIYEAVEPQASTL